MKQHTFLSTLIVGSILMSSTTMGYAHTVSHKSADGPFDTVLFDRGGNQGLRNLTMAGGVDIHQDLGSHIVLLAGTTMFEGIAERMEEGFKDLSVKKNLPFDP